MSKPTKIWHCNSCKTNFTPTPPNYSCPECRSNMTVPGEVKEYQSLEKRVEMRQGPTYSIQKCSSCGTIMHRGILNQNLVDVHAFFDHDTVISWAREGFIPDGVDVIAYACPQCGKIEMRLRNPVSSRDYVSKAPTN